MKQNIAVTYIVKASIIAAIYCVLTVMLEPISFGAVQCRVAEAMTILPLFMPEAVPGLFVGCIFANIFGGLGPIDIVFGSLTTMAAAFITSKMPNKYFGVFPPIILNALIVSIWVSKFTSIPYLATAAGIGFGEFLSAGVLGLILAAVFEKIAKNYIR